MCVCVVGEEALPKSGCRWENTLVSGLSAPGPYWRIGPI